MSCATASPASSRKANLLHGDASRHDAGISAGTARTIVKVLKEERLVGVVVALALMLGAGGLCQATGPTVGRDELRVCADPNNLPFSNRAGDGFENRIAQIVGRAMGRRVVYTWWPQRRGFLRQTLRARACDVVMGVPASSGMLLPTQPYYRSSYVFVSRRDRHLAISSVDDPRLRRLRSGIQLTGNDYENPPPAQALAVRHLADNVRGFMVYGDYSTPAPQRDVIDAVADGRVDIAIVWGPVAGYFAGRAAVPLDIHVASAVATVDQRLPPLTFPIGMGVRRDDRGLHTALDAAIASRRQEIRRVLHAYGVPLIETAPHTARRNP
jgi:mxaJ protein